MAVHPGQFPELQAINALKEIISGQALYRSEKQQWEELCIYFQVIDEILVQWEL